MERILICDDSRFIRSVLKDIFVKLGHTVIDEVSNGAEAIQAYEYYQPSLVTLDLEMPGIDGIRALQLLVTSFPKAKVIIISGNRNKELLFESLRSGAKYYISKPVTEDKIIDAFRKLNISTS
ncbi:response regulator [Halalkalibacter oceani]|uniref:Response regulator n=1 Tax=Halalkalibacter oceani TaxID=1653776 RepID=A0A9X2DSM0_9BACI|nr:response regulator [Halalkalibacter oceani]MCM3716366.1 response regulator [Halalkalibacter oceani]